MSTLPARFATALVVAFAAAAGLSVTAAVAAGDAELAEPADAPNGFALTDLRVPRSDIVGGGPARDSIESVDAPRLVSIAEAGWVRGDSPVIGVARGGVARAYPVHLLEWHQVVNDRFPDGPVLIAYDPLTDIASAWRPPADAGAAFGVSGLLDRDGFLLFDRATASLWSSVTGEAVAGPRAGERLVPLPVQVEALRRWAARHPDTEVLALPDRARIDYRRSPYSAYWVSDTFPLAVRARDARFHPKQLVLGVELGPRSRAYVATAVNRAGGRIVDEFASRRIRVEYDAASGTFSYEAPPDVRVRSAYWFAWKSLHPDTEVWGPELGSPASDPAPVR